MRWAGERSGSRFGYILTDIQTDIHLFPADILNDIQTDMHNPMPAGIPADIMNDMQTDMHKPLVADSEAGTRGLQQLQYYICTYYEYTCILYL